MRALFLLITALLFIPISSFAATKHPKSEMMIEAKSKKPKIQLFDKFVITDPINLPDINFMDEKGTKHNIEEFDGKMVILHVWATWCLPCIEELPKFDAFKKEMRKENVVFVPLSVDFKGQSVVADLYNRLRIANLPIYVDEKQNILNKLGITSVPATILIDQNGKEFARSYGTIDWMNPEIVQFIKDQINAELVN